MNRILITTTALVAFAGAASAEITFDGDVELGFNDDEENGFFFESNLAIGGGQVLNNGLEAGFSLDVDIGVDRDGSAFKQNEIRTSDFVMWLKSDVASMYFGDTKTAAEVVVDSLYKSAVYGEYDMDNRFLRKTDLDNGGNAEGVIRGEYDYAGWQFAASGVVFEDDNNPNATQSSSWDVGALQVAAKGAVNNFNLGFAYQEEEDLIVDKWIFGQVQARQVDELASVFVGTTYGGFDLTLGYIGNLTDDTNSTILTGAYNYGMGTVALFYVNESIKDRDVFGIEASYENGATYIQGRVARSEAANDFDFTDVRLDGSYDTGRGLIVRAGGHYEDHENQFVEDVEEAYVGFEYDLGNSATLLLSHAYSNVPVLDVDGEWEIGEPEYKKGTTMQIGFEF